MNSERDRIASGKLIRPAETLRNLVLACGCGNVADPCKLQQAVATVQN